MSIDTGDNLEECLSAALSCAKSHKLIGRVIFRFNDVRFDISRNSNIKQELKRYKDYYKLYLT